MEKELLVLRWILIKDIMGRLGENDCLALTITLVLMLVALITAIKTSNNVNLFIFNCI